MRCKSLLFCVLACAIIASCLAGCRTVGLAEMSPTGRLPQLLPHLEARIDVPSLEGLFGGMIIKGSVSDFGYYEGVLYANPFVQDLITLYDRDMRNITEEYGPLRGSAVCRVVDGDVSGGGFVLACLSGITMFIPNLLGLPFAYSKASIQLEMSIFTTQGTLAGRYTSKYNRKRVPVALYYGYGSDSGQKVTIDAFKACMTDIKIQVEADFDRLQGALSTPSADTLAPSQGTIREPVLRENW